ncbi:MAG TPA: hypothetical protein ENK75_05355, partial [Saprospiraceae bacterium]|nr:hypothetical protein [Saprospiraceae bacterium]
FKPKPIHFPDSLYSKMRMDKELVDKSLRAYQYANTQLGQFIHKIRTSEFGKNTLIVITGDHNLHRGFNYDESESFLAHSVPIIFYIPDKYKHSPPNTKIFSSHKDIFPSIYPLALSNATYFNTGQNLFTDLDHFSINDFTFAANRYGAVTLGDVTHFYKWTDSTKNHLIRSQKNEYLDILSQKLKAYKAIMGYTIQKELSQKENE